MPSPPSTTPPDRGAPSSTGRELPSHDGPRWRLAGRWSAAALVAGLLLAAVPAVAEPDPEAPSGLWLVMIGETSHWYAEGEEMSLPEAVDWAAENAPARKKAEGRQSPLMHDRNRQPPIPPMQGLAPSGPGSTAADDYFARVDPAPLQTLESSPEVVPASRITTWTRFEQDVFRLVNDRRSRAAHCGAEGYFPAAPPVRPDDRLRHAARSHVSDMAEREYFGHESPEGTTVAQRIERAGFRSWRRVGENLAAGPGTPAEVVQAWMDSDGHCATLMSPQFELLGVGHVHDDSDLGDWWAQAFATNQAALSYR